MQRWTAFSNTNKALMHKPSSRLAQKTNFLKKKKKRKKERKKKRSKEPGLVLLKTVMPHCCLHPPIHSDVPTFLGAQVKATGVYRTSYPEQFSYKAGSLLIQMGKVKSRKCHLIEWDFSSKTVKYEVKLLVCL